MDKGFLLTQLGERLRDQVQQTHQAASEATQDARSGAARAVNLAKAQLGRSTAAREALDALDTLHLRPLRPNEPISLGAVVEVEDEQGGRTLFLAPAGAGVELTLPGGDGFLHVVTPASPFGRALLGRRRGDVVEVKLADEVTEWTVTYVA